MHRNREHVSKVEGAGSMIGGRLRRKDLIVEYRWDGQPSSVVSGPEGARGRDKVEYIHIRIFPGK